MTIRSSGLKPEQAAFLQKLGNDAQARPLNADQRAQLEKAVKALGDDEVVSLSTLAKLQVADDIKPHFLQMTLAHRFGAETAQTLTNNQGLAAGIKSLADASGAAVTDIEGQLASFFTELHGPGLVTHKEAGLRLSGTPNIEVTGDDTVRLTAGSAPDTPAGKVNHFAATLKRSGGEWSMHVEHANPDRYDGPKTLALTDLPRDTLLTLEQYSDIVAKREFSADPRAAGLAKSLGDVVTTKNGELGFFPPANPMFSVKGSPKGVKDVTKIEMRPTGIGFGDKSNTGDFIKGDDEQWVLHLHAPQRTPDGPRTTVQFSELPTETLLAMEARVLYSSEAATYSGSTHNAGLEALLVPIQQELGQRRAGLEDKLEGLLDGQLVKRTTLGSLTALAKSLLDATGFSAEAKLQRAGENVSSTCDELAMALTMTSPKPGSQKKLLAEAGQALQTLGALDTSKMSPILASYVDSHVRLALGTLNNLKEPIRGTQNDVANLSKFRDQAVAYLQKTESADPKLLEDTKAGGWAEARINLKASNTKVDTKLGYAAEMIDAATARLRTLQRTARFEGGGGQVTSALWMDAMSAVQEAASTMRSAEQGTHPDKQLDQEVTGALMASLRGFRKTWTALLKAGGTTKESYLDALADAQYLTKVSPLRWQDT